MGEQTAGRQPLSGPLGSTVPRTDPRIQLLYLPRCPLVDQVRTTLRESLSAIGSRAKVEEIERPCASPTLLIHGVDVTGRTPPQGTSCRLDLPTKEQIVAALAGSSAGA
jgi:hypothetical protein